MNLLELRDLPPNTEDRSLSQKYYQGLTLNNPWALRPDGCGGWNDRGTGCSSRDASDRERVVVSN